MENPPEITSEENPATDCENVAEVIHKRPQVRRLWIPQKKRKIHHDFKKDQTVPPELTSELNLAPETSQDQEDNDSDSGKTWTPKLKFDDGETEMTEDQPVSDQLELSTRLDPESCDTTVRPELEVVSESVFPQTDIVRIARDQDNMIPQVQINPDHTDLEGNPMELSLSQDTIHTVTTSQGLCMVMSTAITSEDDDQELMDINERPFTTPKTRLPKRKRLRNGDKPKPFHCETCGKSFAENSQLVEHENAKTCSGEKPFKCEYCHETFRQKGNMQRHVRTHTGEKPFKCHFCDEAFRQKGNLQRHVRMHTGERPFKCGFCSQAFTDNGSLQRHIRTHTAEKRFKCGLCVEAFTTENSLRLHIKTHTGERIFRCELCSKEFTRQSSLRRHKKSHSGEKPFKCVLCGKEFTRKSSLQDHERLHFGEKSLQM